MPRKARHWCFSEFEHFYFLFLMAHCEVLRGPQGEDKPCPDLNKHSIALHFVHAWGGIKCHNSNMLNNGNGILKIQSKVSLKCKLPWSYPEQTTGEEANMTALSTPPPTKHTHTHTHRINAVAAPALDSSGHSCGKVQWRQGSGGD